MGPVQVCSATNAQSARSRTSETPVRCKQRPVDFPSLQPRGRKVM